MEKPKLKVGEKVPPMSLKEFLRRQRHEARSLEKNKKGDRDRGNS